MQEEVENRTINLAISTTKLTWRTLVNAFRAYKQHRDKAAARAGPYPHGKQTVKELIGQKQGVSNIEIQNTGIKDFERVARKYGIDYAITKDSSTDPPKYLVFFKARDADAMTAAFNEYGAQQLKRERQPDIMQELKKLKALVAAIPNKMRNKKQERDL